ncbi:MAG TPA: DUF11 domain-containing protein [Blastocatellia bacterium]|nr:DUF11 domain-containing protein [Blastocatellia bacterium]
MKKYTLTIIAMLLLFPALNSAGVRGLLSWLNTPAVTKAEVPGKDGSLTVTTANTIVNRYSFLVVDAPAGSTTLTVNNPGGSSGLDPAALSAGDLLLIIQMAGASIDTSDTPNYGTVTSLNNAGRYEYATVLSVNGNTITINASCGGLKYSYTVSGKVQVLRVPQYSTLTIDSGASLAAPPWDGRTGGLVAVNVQGDATINGTIEVSGLGFRGGALSDADETHGRTDYRSTNVNFGAEKGEGIAGYQADYDAINGRYARGAPANAGGGGTHHTSGGGGGANGNNGRPWNGQGIMDPNPAFLPAWALDPGYINNGNALTNSSGGGRGGYSYSVREADALVSGPGAAVWAADFRREIGGLGGRPVDHDLSGRLFFGGGGGAGTQNNFSGGAGGNAGGLIFIIANSVNGSGVLRANGSKGGDTRNMHRDAAGGGGAGGTIVVATNTLSGIRAEANGGNGGNQSTPDIVNFRDEAEGPGGGGGGGFIAFTGGSLTTSVTGGLNGTTTATSVTEFTPNGATRGAGGATSNVINDIPFCRTGSDISITKTDNISTIVPGATTTYTITVRNNGPNSVFGIPVVDNPPPVLSNVFWTCTATAGSRCADASGINIINTRVDLQANGVATFQLTGTLSPTATGTVSNTASAQPPPGTVDNNPGNNTDTDTDTIAQSSDLAITKAATTPSVPAGGEATFTIQVTNNGPTAVTGAQVTDTLPATLTNASWTCSATGGSSCAAASGSGNINTTVNLLVNGRATFVLRATVAPTATGTISNTARVTPPAGVTDPNPGNNSSTATIMVAQGSNVAVSLRNTANDICIGQQTRINVEVRLTNNGDGIQRNNSTAEFVGQFPPEVSGTPASCTASNGQCTVTSAGVEWNGTIGPQETVLIAFQVITRFDLSPGTRFCITYRANYDSDGDGVNDSVATAPSCFTANCGTTPPPCTGPGCPTGDPGVPVAEGPNTVASDDRSGSVLIFPYYTSDATGLNQQETRFTITNRDPFAPAFIHLFFVDGATCSVADNFLCMTPNQTVSFLASALDPGTSGYIIAVAVDRNGCPTNFNRLIGEEAIKTSSGHSAILGAIAVQAIAPPTCTVADTLSTINFDGVQYARLGRTLALDNVPSVADGNSTLLVLNRIGGDLTSTATALGPIFGLAFDDQELGFSFNFNPSLCQLRAVLSDDFPRLTPRYSDVVPAGRSGWIKFGLQSEGAMVGVMLNANPNQDGFRGGHNLHNLTLGNTSLTIPIIAPPCI